MAINQSNPTELQRVTALCTNTLFLLFAFCMHWRLDTVGIVEGDGGSRRTKPKVEMLLLLSCENVSKRMREPMKLKNHLYVISKSVSQLKSSNTTNGILSSNRTHDCSPLMGLIHSYRFPGIPLRLPPKRHFEICAQQKQKFIRSVWVSVNSFVPNHHQIENQP